MYLIARDNKGVKSYHAGWRGGEAVWFGRIERGNLNEFTIDQAHNERSRLTGENRGEVYIIEEADRVYGALRTAKTGRQ
jgi:hypothetical protein